MRPLPVSPPDTWTPKLVGERLTAAVRWCAGAPRVGPAGMVSARMPEVRLDWRERLAEGWGLPDGPDEDELAWRRQALRRAATPAQITGHLAALGWPSAYLADRPGDARVLSLWVRCRVYRVPFQDALRARSGLDRSLAYRMRDRALVTISVGLDRDGVAVAA
jgi:hypothetical protein